MSRAKGNKFSAEKLFFIVLACCGFAASSCQAATLFFSSHKEGKSYLRVLDRGSLE